MKKILWLANPFSIHTQRLEKGLSARGFEIEVFGQKTKQTDKYLFLKMLPPLFKKIRSFRPDLIHAHFASNYGFLGALSGKKPFVISTWGEDIASFPNQSFLRKHLLKWTLSRADRLFATSSSLADLTGNYTSNKVEVTPFGVDTDLFSPRPSQRMFDKDAFVIGTFKGLYPVYGMEDLIFAFHQLKQAGVHPKLKLVMGGEGPLKEKFEKLFIKLGIEKDVLLTGQVPHKELPQYFQSLDVAVFPSHREAFGVSIIEALACEVPTVVSDLPALKEVTQNGKGALIAEKANPGDLAEKISLYIKDKALGEAKGKEGRKIVLEHYDFQKNLDTMARYYEEILGR